MINNTALTIFGIWVAIGIYGLILQYFYKKQLEQARERKRAAKEDAK